MLVIFFIEGVTARPLLSLLTLTTHHSPPNLRLNPNLTLALPLPPDQVFLKVCSTRKTRWLEKAVLQKLDGNIGVLIGEYIVVAATYIIMGANLIPVFEEPRTGRRVYAVRYMEWTIDACGLVYLDCRILFGMQFSKFRMLLVYSVLYMLFGLWAALASTWMWYAIFLSASWFFFGLVCYYYWTFHRQNPSPLQQFGRAPIKQAILVFVIVWWVLYGVLFMVCFQAPDVVPQWLEQLLWTGMDVVMKLSHTVVLMAWRETQWEIDAVVDRQKVEAGRTIAQLDHQRAIHERDLVRLRSRVYYGDHIKSQEEIKSEEVISSSLRARKSRQSQDGTDPSSALSGASSTKEPSALEENSGSAASSWTAVLAKREATSSPFARVNQIFMREAGLCLVLCLAFVVALLHLPVYSEWFGVEVLDAEAVPHDELGFFHHGWTTMLVVFLIEGITVLLKVWSTWHDPRLAENVAQQLSGNLGVLIAEYLVVGATYVILGYNLMPVFVVHRPGVASRRVYAVRYMEWAVDATGLIWLDCHCLFSRNFNEFRMAIVWTVAYMLFGLWSALASTWAWYWAFLLASWAAFLIVCLILVRFLRQDPYPHQPFGKTPVKPCILAFIIGWWVLYGILFMVCFQAPDAVPQWLEQFLWTGMDVVMKLSHTVVLMAWRTTEWNVCELHGRNQAEKNKKSLLNEGSRARQEKQQLEAIMLEGRGAEAAGRVGSVSFTPSSSRRRKETDSTNWTATPGLRVDLSSMVRLEGQLAQGLVTDVHRKGMMRSEDLAELKRLEESGFLQTQQHRNWESQTREMTFLSHGINHIAYDPRNWMQTLLAVRGRAPTSFLLWVVLVESSIVLALSKFFGESFDLGVSSGIHSLFGVLVSFLVVFRTQAAFKKWWSGRSAVSSLVQMSRTFAQQVCAYVKDEAYVNKMVRYSIATVVATRCHLRNTRIDPAMLLGVLREEEIEELNRQKNLPFYTAWVIRSTLGEAVAEGACLPLHMAIENAVKAIEQSIADAERLLTPMPFTYVVHVRTFLFIYLMGLPFILVEDLGWLMLVAVSFLGYLMIGLENTAVQLENPFGTDCNHHPLDLYCLEVSQDLLHLLDLRASAKAQVDQPPA